MKVNKASWAFTDTALSIEMDRAYAKHVLNTLAKYANSATGECYPSRETLARLSCCTIRQVDRELIYLRDVLKVITWTTGHKGRSNTYKLCLNTMKSLVCKFYNEDNHDNSGRQWRHGVDDNGDTKTDVIVARTPNTTPNNITPNRTRPLAKNFTEVELKSKDMNQPSSDVTGSGGPVVFQQEQTESVSYTFKEQRKARFEYMRINGGDPGVWQSLKAEFEPEEKLA